MHIGTHTSIYLSVYQSIYMDKHNSVLELYEIFWVNTAAKWNLPGFHLMKNSIVLNSLSRFINTQILMMNRSLFMCLYWITVNQWSHLNSTQSQTTFKKQVSFICNFRIYLQTHRKSLNTSVMLHKGNKIERDNFHTSYAYRGRANKASPFFLVLFCLSCVILHHLWVPWTSFPFHLLHVLDFMYWLLYCSITVAYFFILLTISV